MENKGRLIEAHRDFRTKKWQLAFELDYFDPEEDLNGDLRIIAKKWRNKRSLDSNGYLWALIEQIAMQLDSTHIEIYEDLIQQYGLMDRDESGYITVTMRAGIDKSHLPGHWKLDGEHSTIDWKVYRRIRGTSEYDTKEMAWFLDRVIEEAKALGIETATPEELERIKAYERQRTCQ